MDIDKKKVSAVMTMSIVFCLLMALNVYGHEIENSDITEVLTECVESAPGTDLCTTIIEISKPVNISDLSKFRLIEKQGSLDSISNPKIKLNGNQIIITGEVKWGTKIYWGIETDTILWNSTWWNSTWPYKQNITITSPSAKTDWQVEIEINTTPLYEAGKLNITCNDLRFLNGSDNTELDFWTENCTTNDNTTNSIIWVEVDEINTTIYMYYGNPNIGSESDGNATFLIFDDFESGSIDTGMWFKQRDNQAGWKINCTQPISGTCSLWPDTSTDTDYSLLIANTGIAGATGICSRVLTEGIGSAGQGRPKITIAMEKQSGTTDNKGYVFEWFSDDVRTSELQPARVTVVENTSIGFTTANDIIYTIELCRLNNETLNTSFYNNTESVTLNGTEINQTFDYTGVGINNWGINLDALFDNFFTYKWDGEDITYSFGDEEELIISVTFINQSPADVNSLNLFGIPLEINYTIIASLGLNTSNISMFYKTNNTFRDNLIYTNGTLGSGFDNISYLYNISDTFVFNLLDNEIYPATYNINERAMENTPHLVFDLDSNSEYVKVELYNISTINTYGILEIMTINQTPGANPLRVYYCNSSYTTGNPETSDYCGNFFNIEAGPYNHTHTVYSSHQLVPFGINTTTVELAGVLVTNTSYFLVRGNSGIGNEWNLSYISNISRTTANQYTNNNGATWVNGVATVDLHVHQYNETENLWYYACASDILGSTVCSTLRNDSLQIRQIPPTAPDVYSPTAGFYIYAENISINYTESISPIGNNISHYNISLLFSNFTFVRTIQGNNTLNLSYLWLPNFSDVGFEYIIEVEACDINSLCSGGFSEPFNITDYLINITVFDGDYNVQNRFSINTAIIIRSFSYGTFVTYRIFDPFDNLRLTVNATSIGNNNFEYNWTTPLTEGTWEVNATDSYSNSTYAEFIVRDYTAYEFWFFLIILIVLFILIIWVTKKQYG